MIKPKNCLQLDLLYVPQSSFEVNTYKYISAGLKVASIYKITGALRTKKAREVVFGLHNSSEFISGMAKLLEKHNADVQRGLRKYKHTQIHIFKHTQRFCISF